MFSENQLTLVHPQTGDLAFKMGEMDHSSFNELQRLSYFSVIWIQEGKGTLITGFSEYQVEENCMLFFSPYRPFLIRPEGELKGEVLHFNSDFFCIYKHDKEVGCNGVFFNNVFDPPVISVPPDATTLMDELQTKKSVS